MICPIMKSCVSHSQTTSGQVLALGGPVPKDLVLRRRAKDPLTHQEPEVLMEVEGAMCQLEGEAWQQCGVVLNPISRSLDGRPHHAAS